MVVKCLDSACVSRGFRIEVPGALTMTLAVIYERFVQ